MNYFRTAILLAAMTALFMAVGAVIGGQSGMLIAFFIALAMNAFSYWRSDKMVLRMHGAQEVDAGSAPEYYDIVRQLAENAGLPMPRVYIMHNDQPNAFATGRNPENAAVAATSGLLNQLSREEVAGVIAHELAHIKNHDTLIMTITATIAGAISMLANFGLFFGGNRNNNPLGFIGTLLVIFVAPMAAALVQMAISRGREFEADRIGAEISGKPEHLASALVKISNGAARIPNETAERHPETGQLMIINPLNGKGRDNLFSTHPATQNRIDRLMAMSGSTRVRLDPDGPSPFEARKRGPWG